MQAMFPLTWWMAGGDEPAEIEVVDDRRRCGVVEQTRFSTRKMGEKTRDERARSRRKARIGRQLMLEAVGRRLGETAVVSCPPATLGRAPKGPPGR